jgi:thiol-disulfide isomerase/thioredoxin
MMFFVHAYVAGALAIAAPLLLSALPFAGVRADGLASPASATGLDRGRRAAIQQVATLDTMAAADAVSASALRDPQNALLEPRQWLNVQPLRPEDIRGKVVVVNFWTYSCINSLRALPYLRAWDAKYRGRGLLVIGVHTPEFAFEKDLANVREATASLGVGYPVVLDSDYRIWRAFDNQAWPGFYFIGADGRVRRRLIGEGGYEESERLIQQLLSEAGGPPVADAIVGIAGEGPQAAADEPDLMSAETYVGYAQAANFASPGGVRKDAPHLYRGQLALPLNRWSLGGVWTVGSEFASLSGPTGAIAFRFHARDLHFVLAPPAKGRSVRFRIKIDGAAPGVDHGADVDAEGRGSVTEARMYQLVRQRAPIADRTFEIEFLDAGVRAYVFTFG